MRRLCAVLVTVILCMGLLPSYVSAGNSQYFPETGQTSSNAFYEFWQTHGALPILGMPLSLPYNAKTGFLTQFYERGVMEWHPENAQANRVQLGRLGDLYLNDFIIAKTGEDVGDMDRRKAPRGCATTSDCETFGATNHTVVGAFRDYWYKNGGLTAFGYPLTEEIPLCSNDYLRNQACGPSFSGQIFERSVFEWHPEIGSGTVLLRRLGAYFWEGVNKDNIQARTVPDYDGISQSAPVYTSPPASAYTPPAPANIPPPPPPAPVYSSPPAPVYSPPPVSSGSVSGSGYSCPAGYPIKGNLTTYNGEKIYHVPGGQFYDSTKPEQCFATEADARAAGYRASLR